MRRPSWSDVLRAPDGYGERTIHEAAMRFGYDMEFFLGRVWLVHREEFAGDRSAVPFDVMRMFALFCILAERGEA